MKNLFLCTILSCMAPELTTNSDVSLNVSKDLWHSFNDLDRNLITLYVSTLSAPAVSSLQTNLDRDLSILLACAQNYAADIAKQAALAKARQTVDITLKVWNDAEEKHAKARQAFEEANERADTASSRAQALKHGIDTKAAKQADQEATRAEEIAEQAEALYSQANDDALSARDTYVAAKAVLDKVSSGQAADIDEESNAALKIAAARADEEAKRAAARAAAKKAAAEADEAKKAKKVKEEVLKTADETAKQADGLATKAQQANDAAILAQEHANAEAARSDKVCKKGKSEADQQNAKKAAADAAKKAKDLTEKAQQATKLATEAAKKADEAQQAALQYAPTDAEIAADRKAAQQAAAVYATQQQGALGKK